MRPALVFALAIAAWAAGPPARIVSTAPSFTEMLYAMGAGDRVVGVSTYCHFPEVVNRLPRVGSYLKPNIEAIARLKPDLVLVHTELPSLVSQLNAVGLRVQAIENTTLEETIASASVIGAAVGLEDAGRKLEQSIRARLRSIEQANASRPRRSLLFIVGRTPGQLDGIIAVGRGSFLNELIRIAGGRNVLADSPVTYPRISIEAILRLDPDVIVDMGDMAVTTGVTEAHKQSVVRLWQAQAGVRAVREKRVFAVAADIFVVPGPRVGEAAEQFARMLGNAP
jgi:iron complex transport system substrate-binding protein